MTKTLEQTEEQYQELPLYNLLSYKYAKRHAVIEDIHRENITIIAVVITVIAGLTAVISFSWWIALLAGGFTAWVWYERVQQRNAARDTGDYVRYVHQQLREAVQNTYDVIDVNMISHDYEGRIGSPEWYQRILMQDLDYAHCVVRLHDKTVHTYGLVVDTSSEVELIPLDDSAPDPESFQKVS